MSETRQIEPFGYWPDARSIIAGLGGVKPAARPDYAFHSDYVVTEPGPASFVVRFRNLRATRGILRLKILSARFDDGAIANPVRAVKTVRLRLKGLADRSGQTEVRFKARPFYLYAIVGYVSKSVTDAVADALTIAVEPCPPVPSNRTAMLAAREAIFRRGSLVERSWWRRTSPLDRQGLISAEPATIAAPTSQLCTARQLDEPAYGEWLKEIGEPQWFHRKQWESVYVLAVLRAQGVLRLGSRGLGFGCGTEWLPSYLAGRGCEILATDLPADHGDAAQWRETGQFSDALEQLFFPRFLTKETFDGNVTFRSVDMTRLPGDLAGFDFNWSLCAFEHLGSIEAGMRFVHAAVGCLKPGGVAVHTTEFNLTSDRHTVDNQPTVLFRRRDMERLALDLTRAGHRVLPLKYDPGDSWFDEHIDVPPYGETNHLKLALRQYVSTSFGIAVIRDGATA